MRRLDLGQTVMQNPGHFWQLMKTELICAVVMMYLWVGRDLWVEGAEHNPLSNDRLLPLVCVCISKSSPPLLFLLCFTCQPNLSYPCAGGLNVALLIYESLFRKENMYDLPTGQFSNGWSVYQRTTQSAIQGHFVKRFIDGFVLIDMSSLSWIYQLMGAGFP